MLINNLNDKEIRLEVLRLVKEVGSNEQKNDPLPIAEKYYNWIVSKKIRKTSSTNLADKKEQTSTLKEFKSKNRLLM